MKQIFFFMMLVCMIACLDERDKIIGPAYNYEDRRHDVSCSDLYVRNGDVWLDEPYGGQDSADIPSGVSDCIDLQLWSSGKNQYYDKCCYVRFQKDGVMHAGCVGLAQEQLIDITETIKRMEDGDRGIWTRDGYNSKIYQLDCSSSYIKYVSLAFIAFICLFF
jgi:hypothetical protein